jgi:hypothetical protein
MKIKSTLIGQFSSTLHFYRQTNIKVKARLMGIFCIVAQSIIFLSGKTSSSDLATYGRPTRDRMWLKLRKK